MSTSELRRGPGWWMDPNGSWNPPESWPESSPPLPGWERLADGSWHNPHAEDFDLGAPDDPSTNGVAQQRPVPDTPAPTVPSLDTLSEGDDQATPRQVTKVVANGETLTDGASNNEEPAVEKKTPSLQYASTEAIYVVSSDYENKLRNKAIRAAIFAALLTAMIGGGIVVLLATL